jgi:hypothetical protein
MSRFLSSPDIEDLKAVPGIGDKNKAHLQAVGLNNTYQLIGKFMHLRQTGDSSKEHCDRLISQTVF